VTARLRLAGRAVYPSAAPDSEKAGGKARTGKPHLCEGKHCPKRLHTEPEFEFTHTPEIAHVFVGTALVV